MNWLPTIAIERLLERTGWALVHSVWECAAVAIVLALVLRCLRSPGARYLAGCAALAACAILPVTTVLLLQARPPLEQSMTAIDSSSGGGAPLFFNANESLNNSAPLETMTTPSVSDSWSRLLPIAATIWFIGVVALSLRHVAGLLAIRRLRRGAIPLTDPAISQYMEQLLQRLQIRRAVKVAQSAAVQVPALIGWMSPLVLLPCSAISGLTPLQLRALLAHELAHVRRHDYLVNLLQTIVETLLFYHPLTWWISATIRQEREHCCDDLAAATVGSAHEYGAALAAMEQLRLPGEFVLAANGGSLLRRIRRLVKPEPRATSYWPLLLLVAVILTVTACSQMSQSPEAQAQPTPAASGQKPSAPPVEPAAPVVITVPATIAPTTRDSRIIQVPATLSPATQPDGELANLERKLSDLKLKLLELQTTRGPQHPDVVNARNQVSALEMAYQQRLQTLKIAQEIAAGRRDAANVSPEVLAAIRQQFGYLPDAATGQENNEQMLRAMRAREMANQQARRLQLGNPKTNAFDGFSNNLRITPAQPHVFYISGVEHSGAFTLPDRRNIALRDAIELAAKENPPGQDKYVVVIRSRSNAPRQVISMPDVTHGAAGATEIGPGDVVMIASQATLPLSPEHRYQVDGDVPNPGYYSLTDGITLLQALVAAGMNPADSLDWTIEVKRNANSAPWSQPNTFAAADLITGEIGAAPIRAGDVLHVASPHSKSTSNPAAAP